MNKTNISILLTSAFLLFFSFGCATQKPMYYWGDYSGSLYKVHKDPNEKNLAEHQVQLETIIKQSEEKNLRVPPGVFGELGYIYALKNNSKEAIYLFEMEKQTYPESTIFMDNMIQQVEKREKIEDNAQTPIEEMKAADEEVIGNVPTTN